MLQFPHYAPMANLQRMTRIIVGIALGGMLGMVLYWSTQYQWQAPLSGAILEPIFCCYPNSNSTTAPFCATVPTLASCPGNTYTTANDCSKSCAKMTLCCKNGGTQSAACHTGVKYADGRVACDGLGSYDDLNSCFAGCAKPPPASSAPSSSGIDNAVYCCNPADSTHATPYCSQG